jgi:hypothetical protein
MSLISAGPISLDSTFKDIILPNLFSSINCLWTSLYLGYVLYVHFNDYIEMDGSGVLK